MNKLNNTNRLLIIYLALIVVISLIFNVNSPIKGLILIFSLIIGFVSILYYSKNKKLHRTAFVIILLFGLMCVFLSPINSISDENEHLWRADLTSQGLFIPEYINEGNKTGYLTIESFENMPTDKTIFETDWDSKKINYNSYLANSAFVQNPFYLYIVQSIGIDVAKLLNLNNIWMIWFGRIANLILYASICAVAIKIAPTLKIPLMVVATMPLAVIQGASFSADAFILSFSLVVIAYLLYMYKAKDGSLSKRNILIFFILVTFVGFGRVTLAGLSLLILIVPKNKFKNPKYYFLGILGIGILLCILLCWTKFYAVDSISHSWRKSLFAQKHVNATEQAKFMLTNSNALIPFMNIFSQIPVQIDALSRIYTNFVTFPLFNHLYVIFLVLIAFIYPIKEKLAKKTRILVFITVTIIILGTYIVQYLTWAPVGAMSLLDAGVVPRYFIPVLALLPLIFNVNSNKEIKDLNLIVITAIVVFLSLIMMFIGMIAY